MLKSKFQVWLDFESLTTYRYLIVVVNVDMPLTCKRIQNLDISNWHTKNDDLLLK
jgi:hypothetical protein